MIGPRETVATATNVSDKISLPDEKPSALERAINEEMYVTVASRNKYHVYTKSDTEWKKHIVSLGPPENCNCKDFFVNRLPDYRFTRCKHIWRAIIEVMLERVPVPKTNPHKWIINQIESDLFHLADNDTEIENKEELGEELKQLKKRLELDIVQIEHAILEWHKIHSKIHNK